jgi:sugar/nucleoside kinase (ribokinase family)
MNPSLQNATPRRWLLLSVGDPVVDIVVATKAPPALGEKVVGRPLGMLAGGTTSNVACAVARLGRPSAVYGRTGDDAPAALLRASFADFGVADDYLGCRSNTPSTSVLMILAECGEKAMIYLPMDAEPFDLAQLAPALAQSRVAYMMPYELDQFDVLSKLARQNGTLVAIDLESAVAPDATAMRERAARADIVFFNQAGFEAGTGGAPSLDAMRAVLALGPQVVVVSLGAAGAMAVTAGEEAVQAAFPAKVIDTTGAGDCFNAAFLVAWLEGEPLSRALRFACAAASYTVTALGGRTALPDREAVRRLLLGRGDAS